MEAATSRVPQGSQFGSHSFECCRQTIDGRLNSWYSTCKHSEEYLPRVSSRQKQVRGISFLSSMRRKCLHEFGQCPRQIASLLQTLEKFHLDTFLSHVTDFAVSITPK